VAASAVLDHPMLHRPVTSLGISNVVAWRQIQIFRFWAALERKLVVRHLRRR